MIRSTILSKFFSLLLVLMVFLTPLLFFIHSHDQFELPKLTLLLVLALPFTILFMARKEKLNITPLTTALFILASAQILSSLPQTSLSWRTSLLGDYDNFSGLATFFTYLLLFRIFCRSLDQALFEKLVFFNTLAALLSSLYALSQHFGFDFIQWNPESVNPSREFAALGNPNFLSAYLALSLPLFLAFTFNPFTIPSNRRLKPALTLGLSGPLGFFLLLAGTAKGMNTLHLSNFHLLDVLFRTLGLVLGSLFFIHLLFIRHWIAQFSISLLLGLGLVATGSRGGFLAAMLGLFLWALLIFLKQDFFDPFRKRWDEIPLFSKSFFMVTAVGALSLIGYAFLGRFFSSLLHIGQSLALSRLHIWGPAFRMALAHPFSGVGLDTFKAAFPYYSGIEFNLIDGMFMSSRMAHNELLQMAATTGFPGLAAYLGVLLAAGILWLKTYRRSSPAAQWWLIALLASALAYHVQNFFSFGVAVINLWWFLILAFIQVLYLKSGPSPTTSKGHSVLSNIGWNSVWLLILSFGLYFPLTRLGADIAFGQGNAVSQMLKSPDANWTSTSLKEYSDYEIEELQRSVSLCPLEVKYPLYLGLACEQRASMEPERGSQKEWELKALQCYQKSLEMSPANAYYYNNEGRVEDVLGMDDPSYYSRAEEAYQKAVHWDPASPFFILNWSNELDKLGRRDEAKERMRQAFLLDRDFAAKILSQRAFEKYKAGEKGKAFEVVKDAIQFNTMSAEAYYCEGILLLSEKDKKHALLDFEKVKILHPTEEKDPYIRSLDQFIAQAKN